METEINLPFISSEGRGVQAHPENDLPDASRGSDGRPGGQDHPAHRDGRSETAGSAPEDVGEIILVGGQTRMPLIKEKVSKFFNKRPAEHINPDEIVAMGAAIQSGILKGTINDLVLLLDVTPFSLGIETENDTFQKIIERNTTIPAKKTMPFTTVEHNQRRVRIHVLQGEKRRRRRRTSRWPRSSWSASSRRRPGSLRSTSRSRSTPTGSSRFRPRTSLRAASRRSRSGPSSGLSSADIDRIIEKGKAGSELRK